MLATWGRWPWWGATCQRGKAWCPAQCRPTTTLGPGTTRGTPGPPITVQFNQNQIVDNKNEALKMLNAEYKDFMVIPVACLGCCWEKSWLVTCQSWECLGILHWLEPFYVLALCQLSFYKGSTRCSSTLNVSNLGSRQSREATGCSRSSDKGCGHDGTCARQQGVTHS